MSIQVGALLSRNRAVRNLFAAGEQGLWLDPSDFSTMFQDSAGTTPVTATGQPVGLIRDKSGRGNHASQVTTTNRPVLQQDAYGRYYLQFDGVDDFLATGSINFSSTDKTTNITGVYRSDDTGRIVFELSANTNSNNGSFSFISGSNAGFTWGHWARGDAVVNSGQIAGVSNAAPDLAVISATHDIAGDRSRLWRNGAKGTDGTADKGAGNFGNYPLYIGARAGTSFFFNGRIYGLIVRGAASTAQQISNAEAWMNARTGAY